MILIKALSMKIPFNSFTSKLVASFLKEDINEKVYFKLKFYCVYKGIKNRMKKDICLTNFCFCKKTYPLILVDINGHNYESY